MACLWAPPLFPASQGLIQNHMEHHWLPRRVGLIFTFRLGGLAPWCLLSLWTLASTSIFLSTLFPSRRGLLPPRTLHSLVYSRGPSSLNLPPPIKFSHACLTLWESIPLCLSSKTQDRGESPGTPRASPGRKPPTESQTQEVKSWNGVRVRQVGLWAPVSLTPAIQNCYNLCPGN